MSRLTIALLLLLPMSASAQEAVSPVPVVVTVGQATLTRAPDLAFVTASVETRAANPRDAQRLNAETIAAVLAKLAAARIPKDALRTLGYDIQQQFDYVQGKQVPRGYLARNSVEVKIDDVARVGEMLDVVVQAGANGVGGVRFDIKDRDAAEREALRMAVADARARADAAASGAGRTIDRVLRIEESRDGQPAPMPRLAMAAMAEQASMPSIEPGLIEIQARVSLTAALK